MENLQALALAQYQPAILCLVLLCLITLVQSFLTAPLAFIKQEQVPGELLKHGHGTLSFRVLRTYANSVENLPAFGFALTVAVVVGVGPAAVNILAMAHVAFRLIFWALYYAGLGRPAGGPRTLAYVGGLVTNVVLAILAIIALI